jgi:hypothetical protein
MVSPVYLSFEAHYSLVHALNCVAALSHTMMTTHYLSPDALEI